MTRINVVPVAELSNQHLFAEFREIRHIPHSLRRSLESRSPKDILASIPPKYVLGAGHKTFFYDKLLFLEKRFYQLWHELRCRSVKFSKHSRLFPPEFTISIKFYNDYVPDEEAMALNRARIEDRLNMKREWYKWTPHLRKLKFDPRLEFSGRHK